MSNTFFLRLAPAVFFLFGFLAVAPILESCSDGPEPFSDFTLHPDAPLQKYAAGRIGIAKPTFARSYLVVAYRYFSGVPLTKKEQIEADALWIGRLGNSDVVETYGDPDHVLNPYLDEHTPHGRENWQEARQQITTTAPPGIEEYKDGPNYSRYVNCGDDALENAAGTLKARAKTFGKDNPGVQEWLRAQDTVFVNCGNPKEPAIPDAAPASFPEILRFDREYQIAAAHMYASQFDDAEKSFEKIAAEEKSPWHEIASYLVARNLVRRASLEISDTKPYQNSQFNTDRLNQAEAKIQSLLRDPNQKKMRDSLEALEDRVAFQLHPSAQTLVISQRLRKAAPEDKFYSWLWDYTMLLDRRSDSRASEFYNQQDTDARAYSEATAERQKDELTDWILTFQASNDSATEHALQSWRAHPASVPWLLAILVKTNASASYSAEVLAAADKIPANSPAYVTAFYHRMRLRNSKKGFAEVRNSIDVLLKSPEDLPAAAKLDLLDLRLDAASDLNDLVQIIGRDRCSNEEYAASNSPCPQVLASHSFEVLNSLPLDTIVQAYENPALPEDIKTQIGRNIWMRAVLLNRHDVAQKLDAQVPSWSATPQGIKPEYIADLVKQYETAITPEEKQFAAVFFLQHQYAFGYEMGTSQPWCASLNGPWQDESVYNGSQKFVPAPTPFLTAEQLKQSATERTTLEAADSQANFYARIAVDFALQHPDDPRVPESLSRAVKNTDRNCNNSRTSALSKKAFVILHSKYPNTSWAKNTKYWY
jgi:hypothetical protein